MDQYQNIQQQQKYPGLQITKISEYEIQVYKQTFAYLQCQKEEIKKNVQMKLPIQNKIDEYKNPEIRKHLLEMAEKCDFYRGVRGDGNCFYRAMGYLFFETIIQDKEKVKYLENLIKEIVNNKYNFMQLFCDRIPQDCIQWYTYDKIKKSLLLGFAYLQNEQINNKNKFEDIFYDMINKNMQFDFSLVVLIRTLALYQFDLNIEQISIFYENKEEQLQQRNRLITYGEEAQFTNLDMTYRALQCSVITHQIDKNQYSKMESGGDNTILEINLFFRPGHYDIVYQKSKKLQRITDIKHPEQQNFSKYDYSHLQLDMQYELKYTVRQQQKEIYQLKEKQIEEKNQSQQILKKQEDENSQLQELNQQLKTEKNQLEQTIQKKDNELLKLQEKLRTEKKQFEQTLKQQKDEIQQLQEQKKLQKQFLEQTIDTQSKENKQLQVENDKLIQKEQNQNLIIQQKDFQIQEQIKEIKSLQSQNQQMMDRNKLYLDGMKKSYQDEFNENDNQKTKVNKDYQESYQKIKLEKLEMAEKMFEVEKKNADLYQEISNLKNKIYQQNQEFYNLGLEKQNVQEQLNKFIISDEEFEVIS